ncbi:MAG TPA: TonB-dependent receptor [Chondromyces sp.]|nr:TonB-dependent receptor [Chondromyces sp.]
MSIDRCSTLRSGALATILITAAGWSWAQVAPQYWQAAAPPFTGELTVTATGVATAVEEAPTAVTVITRDEMDDAQADSVDDMLRRVPGLAVVGSGDEGKAVSVFTRGTASTQTLVMLDGVRLNSPYFGGFDWSRLTTGGVQQVEVARGPYSALWGADAVGGVINVIPVRAGDGFDGRFFGEAGSDSWQRFEAEAGWGGESFDVYVSGADRSGDGSLANSDFSSRQLLLTAGWSFGARGSRLGVIVQDLEADTGIPFATPGDPTPERRQASEQTLIAVPIRIVFSSSWDLQLSAALVEGRFDFADPDDPFFIFSNTETTSSQARFASNHRFSDHLFSWGGEWREEEVTDVSNLGSNLDRETVEISSAFLQDVWQIAPELRLLFGVRLDDSEPWGSETSPRADLGWRLSPAVELRAGYGKAFRPPSLGELYYPFSGNPSLLPETSTSSDLGLAVTSDDRSSRWQLTVFSTDLENLIEFDFASYSNANIGTATIRGAELSWEAALGRRGGSILQATYLDTEDDLGQPLLRRPEWSGSWTLHGAMSEHLTGDLTVVYVGSRDDVDPASFERSRAASYTTADLALAYSLWDGVEITGRVLNIADSEYQEVLGYPAPGRRYIVGLRLGVDKPARWQGAP